MTDEILQYSHSIIVVLVFKTVYSTLSSVLYCVFYILRLMCESHNLNINNIVVMLYMQSTIYLSTFHNLFLSWSSSAILLQNNFMYNKWIQFYIWYSVYIPQLSVVHFTTYCSIVIVIPQLYCNIVIVHSTTVFFSTSKIMQLIYSNN